LNGIGIHGEVCMANIILIIILALLCIMEFVIICAQRLTILEQKHEVHEIRRWHKSQSQKFWGSH
jgi:hypothetical protein